MAKIKVNNAGEFLRSAIMLYAFNHNLQVTQNEQISSNCFVIEVEVKTYKIQITSINSIVKSYAEKNGVKYAVQITDN